MLFPIILFTRFPLLFVGFYFFIQEWTRKNVIKQLVMESLIVISYTVQIIWLPKTMNTLTWISFVGFGLMIVGDILMLKFGRLKDE